MENKSDGKGHWDKSLKFFGRNITAVITKNMKMAVHPIEDRFLNVRELLHLMGFPHDFKLKSIKDLNHICQNVPVPTAKDICDEILKYLNGNLSSSCKPFFKQNFITKEKIKVKYYLQ